MLSSEEYILKKEIQKFRQNVVAGSQSKILFKTTSEKYIVIEHV
jgi:hypothetical protein